jgi:hypothetical protein
MVFGAASTIGAAYDASTDIPDSESADGFDVLEQYFAELGAGGASGTIVFRADQGIEDPAVVAGMEDLFATVNAGFPDDNGNPQHPGATVVSPYTEQGASQIARQGPLAGQLALRESPRRRRPDRVGGPARRRRRTPAIEDSRCSPAAGLAVFEPPATGFIGLAFAVVAYPRLRLRARDGLPIAPFAARAGWADAISATFQHP